MTITLSLTLGVWGVDLVHDIPTYYVFLSVKFYRFASVFYSSNRTKHLTFDQ